ncbi:MAG: glycosyltransferase family 4 protein [Anaerolineales bacterium]|nr:glycosyltransferase family 4 protein [Anaerolineales bacterium]
MKRTLRISVKAIPKLLRKNYNLVFVGFYGHLLMIPVRIITQKPVLFDAFVSTYDTLVSDREKFSSDSLAGKLALWLDRYACKFADHILLDTASHREYFMRNFGIKPNLISALPVGCNEELFFPRQPKTDGDQTKILYYSTYLPLHGVDTVIEAAKVLEGEPVLFELIGEGQEYERIRTLSKELKLENVVFSPYIPPAELPERIAEADICLGGHFGKSAKAERVIPGKIYQMLAMAKPVIATSTTANQELLVHGESAYFCPPADPSSLAAAIITLAEDHSLRSRIALGGRKKFELDCSEAVITNRLGEIITKLLH